MKWTLLSLACLLTHLSNPLPDDEAKREPGERVPRRIRVPEDQPAIQTAIDEAADGDTVLVAPGVYRERIRLRGKEITLASRFLLSRDEKDIRRTVLDGRTVRNGQTKNADAVVHVEGDVGPETRIVGFTIQNGEDGISCHAKIEIAHNQFLNNADAIDYEGGGGICRSNVFENNRDDPVDLDGPCEVIVEENVMRNNGDDGVEIRLHEYSGKLLNIVIRRNRIIGCGEDGIQLVDYPDKSNRVIRIQHNLITNSKQAAIGCMANGNSNENYEAADIPERIEVVNNTLVDNHYGITGGDFLLGFNNVIVGTRRTAIKRVDGDSVLAYNLLWNNGTDNDGSNFVQAGTLSKDPQLDGEYCPMRGSPCVDAGTRRIERGGRTLLDLPRDSYSGSAPDLGAYESAR